METKSNTTRQQAVHWHGALPEEPRHAPREIPSAPSRHSLGLFAKAKAWMSAKVPRISGRQARPLEAAAQTRQAPPPGTRSPDSSSGRWSWILDRLSPSRQTTPSASTTPSSRSMPAPPASPPARVEARNLPPAELMRDKLAIAVAIEQGMNISLAKVNAAMTQRPASETDLPEQTVKDWPRSWQLEFETPDGRLHDLRVNADLSAQLVERESGRTLTLSLRPGQQTSTVAQLARALEVSPTRLLRICTLMSQTEIEPAEAVITMRSGLARAFGEGAQVNPLGGERIRMRARFGAEGGEDHFEMEFMREGKALNRLMVAQRNGDTIPIDLDTDQSFLHWSADIRIDAVGRARVDHASVRHDYTFVEARNAE